MKLEKDNLQIFNLHRCFMHDKLIILGRMRMYKGDLFVIITYIDM